MPQVKPGEPFNRKATTMQCLHWGDSNYCDQHDYTQVRNGHSWSMCPKGAEVHTNYDHLKFREVDYHVNRDKKAWLHNVLRPIHSQPILEYNYYRQRSKEVEKLGELHERFSKRPYRGSTPSTERHRPRTTPPGRIGEPTFKEDPPVWAHTHIPYYMFNKKARDSFNWKVNHISEPNFQLTTKGMGWG